MKILIIVLISMNIISCLYGAYFALTSIIPFIKRKNIKSSKKNPQYKFAILIAARNEEIVIPSLIKSLKKQKYPKDLYDIFVLPNNCTDKTEEISSLNGAKIIDCLEETKTKGDVLKYAFKYFENNDLYDAYVVFDADNIVHPNFLQKINDKMLEGYDVVQGFRDSKNPSDSFISASYTLFYYIQNLFLYQPRMYANLSANINGTGFAISKKLIDKLGFNVQTLTEDMEFSTICAINNIKIAYEPDAITYDEQVIDLKESFKQRKRWTYGTLQILKIYKKDLVKSVKKYHSIHAVDMLFIVSAAFVQFFGTILGLLLFIVNHNIPFTLLSGIISYLFTTIVCLITVLYYKKDVKSLISGILLFPIFIISWLPINIYCIFKKDYNWDPIIHNKNVDVKKLFDNN